MHLRFGVSFLLAGLTTIALCAASIDRYEAGTYTLPTGMNLGTTERARFVPSIGALYGANVRFTVWDELYTKSRMDLAGRKLDNHLIGFLLDFGI